MNDIMEKEQIENLIYEIRWNRQYKRFNLYNKRKTSNVR